jgi:hypothetical protein
MKEIFITLFMLILILSSSSATRRLSYVVYLPVINPHSGAGSEPASTIFLDNFNGELDTSLEGHRCDIAAEGSIWMLDEGDILLDGAGLAVGDSGLAYIDLQENFDSSTITAVFSVDSVVELIFMMDEEWSTLFRFRVTNLGSQLFIHEPAESELDSDSTAVDKNPHTYTIKTHKSGITIKRDGVEILSTSNTSFQETNTWLYIYLITEGDQIDTLQITKP